MEERPQRVPMTPGGFKKLQGQLKHLKATVRPQVIKAIEDARGHGDLAENAEYDIAKEEQLKLSKKIEELEHKLSLAQVIDPSALDHDRVAFGATVKMHDLDSEDVLTYQIVGVDEANINHGKISIEAPIARAMIGKEIGDEVIVKTPKGTRTLAILEITFQ